jgi:Big-like domain-containing protein
MNVIARTWLHFTVVLICVALSAGSALAQGQGLGAVGPLDANGYPSFIADKQNLALEPCLDPPTTTVPVADPCALTGTLPLGDAAPIVFVSNFPQEFFYTNATATVDIGGNKTFILTAVEGGFTAPLPPTVGQQVVFVRTRLRVNGGLTPGATYRATHPYGVIEFVAEANGGLKQVTTDIGCLAAPCGTFQQLLTAVDATGNATVGPYLQAVAPAPPVGYIGDPNITQTVTGSPTGNNFFRIERITGFGGGVISLVTETDQFSLWGKLYTGPSQAPTLTIQRTSYTRNATGTTVNVYARSVGATTVTATVAGTVLNLRPEASGGTDRWFGQAQVPAAQAGDAIDVAATNLIGTTTLSSTLVDEVVIDAAMYDATNSLLTVQAHSADIVNAPAIAIESEEVPPVVLGTIPSGGVFTLNTPAPPAGILVLSAAGGTAIRAVDTTPGGTGGQGTTTLNLVSNLNPSEFKQPVIFTATIVAVGSPTGTVTFNDGATVLGTATVVNKVASLTTSSLAIGTHSITATYSGDATFAGSSSNAVSQVVNKATTTLTLGGSPNPSALGQVVTLAASVTAAPGAGIPTGTVTFFDGGTTLGTATVSSGLASLSTSSLTVGSHLITASYGGDASFKPAASNIFTQTIGTGLSSTTLSVSPNPAARRAAVTYTATVSPTNLSAGGSVTFRSTVTNNKGNQTTTVIGSAVVNASGVAILTAPAPNQRETLSITASYGGNANVASSTSAAVSLVVQ